MRSPQLHAASVALIAVAALTSCAASPSPCDIAAGVLESMEDDYEALPEPAQESYAVGLASIGESMAERIDQAMERTDDDELVAALETALASAEALSAAGEGYEPGDAAGFLRISDASTSLRSDVTEAYVEACAS